MFSVVNKPILYDKINSGNIKHEVIQEVIDFIDEIRNGFSSICDLAVEHIHARFVWTICPNLILCFHYKRSYTDIWTFEISSKLLQTSSEIPKIWSYCCRNCTNVLQTNSALQCLKFSYLSSAKLRRSDYGNRIGKNRHRYDSHNRFCDFCNDVVYK